MPVKGLPSEARFERGKRVLIFDNLSVEQEGVLRITVK